MATNFPNSLDNFTNPASGDSQNSPSHSLQHADINDAVEAIETKLGIGASSAGSATAGRVLVAATGGTTSWTTVGTAGINSTGASAGQVLTANASGSPSWVTPAANNDAWISYTPTITPQTGSLTSYTLNAARYKQIGKLVTLQIAFTITNNGTASGIIYVSTPSGLTPTNYAVGSGRENGITGNMLQLFNSGSNILILTYNNGYAGGTNYSIVGTITYEIA